MLDAIWAGARGVGLNGGWASLVTGEMVDHGPDLSLFVESRSDAYRLVDWVTPELEQDSFERRHRVDRAKVDYRTFEPGWLQVKLIVEPEHKEVLERLSGAISLRDGYLDQKLIQWAISPLTNWNTAKAYQFLHREELEALEKAAKEDS